MLDYNGIQTKEVFEVPSKKPSALKQKHKLIDQNFPYLPKNLRKSFQEWRKVQIDEEEDEIEEEYEEEEEEEKNVDMMLDDERYFEEMSKSSLEPFEDIDDLEIERGELEMKSMPSVLMVDEVRSILIGENLYQRYQDSLNNNNNNCEDMKMSDFLDFDDPDDSFSTPWHWFGY